MDYFNSFDQPSDPIEHEIDAQVDPDYDLTLEQRQARWEKAPWAYPEDNWLFAPLPSSEFDEF